MKKQRTRKLQIQELNAYDYFNNNPLESYLSKVEHDDTTSTLPFLSLLSLESISKQILKSSFMSVMPVQTKVCNFLL